MWRVTDRGQKGQNHGKIIELLPSATNLENLPERPSAEYYDDMTLDEFAVFWPVDIADRPPVGCEKGWDVWEKAALNPVTGIVTTGQETSTTNTDVVRGYIYFQNQVKPKKVSRRRNPLRNLSAALAAVLTIPAGLPAIVPDRPFAHFVPV